MEVQTPVMSLGIVCLVKVIENEHKFSLSLKKSMNCEWQELNLFPILLHQAAK